MAFSTGFKFGPVMRSGGTVTAEAPYNTPQTPFFGDGGVFPMLSGDAASIDGTVRLSGGTETGDRRNGCIKLGGAKAAFIQPLMRSETTSSIQASLVAADSDVTAVANRVGLEVYAGKYIGDPAAPNREDKMLLWNVGFIQSISWVDTTFALANMGTCFKHPYDSTDSEGTNDWCTFETAGVADVSVRNSSTNKITPHMSVAAMSSSAGAIPDMTDGTSASYTGTADATFCCVPLCPFWDTLVLSPASSNENIKVINLFHSYRYNLIY